MEQNNKTGKRQYRELSDATKQRISQSMRNRSKSESHRAALSNSLKNYWSTVGHKPSDDNSTNEVILEVEIDG